MSKPFRHSVSVFAASLLAIACALGQSHVAHAQNALESGALTVAPAPVAPSDPTPAAMTEIAGQTYADLVDLALASPVVARAVVHRQVRLKPEESPGVAAGFVRLYIEADTAALLIGPSLGESLRFLADVRLDANGKVPKLNKTQVLLFGNAAGGKPGELQLTASDTMFAWSPDLETRVRAILTELVGGNAPPRVTGLREALHVPGNLAGEGESQFFLATDSGKPVSISVVRRPGEPTRWGVSFSEIVDQAAQPPRPDTLAWYQLACSMPSAVPERAAISSTEADQRAAAQDYAFVLHELGPCRRNRSRSD
jgi:hypothetical protein